MFKPAELFIGLRYLRAKRRNGFVSLITMISVLGVALGMTVIITVLSVMNGFQEEVRERILSMTAHANVLEIDGTLNDWKQIANQLNQRSEVEGWAPYVEGQAMLVKGTQVTGVLLRGIEPNMEGNVSDLAEHMQEGELDDLKPGEYGILLGSELARFLGTYVGDKVTLVTPQATVTPAGILPKLRRFTVVGVYEVGMQQYDRNTASIHIEDAKKLFRLDGQTVTGLRLRFEDLFDAPIIAKQLNQQLNGYWVADWTRLNSNWFKAVKMEKTMMFIVMLLISAVAAFNIVSALTMVVTDKQSDIAILRTLGMTRRGIQWIFIIQGTVIGIAGVLLGILGGVTLSLNLEVLVSAIEKMMGHKFLDASVYYISELPSQLLASDVILVASISFLLTVVMTIFPAFRAANTMPAEALRYE